MTDKKFIPKVTQKENVVGVDPDLHKSGLAIWSNTKKCWLFHGSVPNEDLPETIAKYCSSENTNVYVEAGWMNKKANFRGGSYMVAQAKARNVGENAGAGKMLIRMIEKLGFEVWPVRPLSKANGILKTIQGSWTEYGREFIKRASGINRMNDDVRDAVYLVIHFRDGHFYLPPPKKKRRK